MRTQLLPILFGALVLAGAARAEDKPWSERAIAAHVDGTQLHGLLSREALEALAKKGEALFSSRLTDLDGAGRPLATQAIVPTKRRRPPENAFQRLAGADSGGCSACHNEPRVGGAGDFVANAFVSEGFESAEFDSLDPQFANERGSVHLFGAGLIELLAREMTADLGDIRRSALAEARRTGKSVTASLSSKGVSFGRITADPDGIVDLSGIDGVDTDLVVRPFSQKGVMTSLRQFTINALNQHQGMEAAERFGDRWTGEHDFDGDGVPDEIGEGDVSALVAFQATLPPPLPMVPQDAAWAAAAQSGGALFDKLQCSACHVRALPLKSLRFSDPGGDDAAGTLRSADVPEPAVYDLGLAEWAKSLPRDEAGNVMVPLFGDLKRHRIADQQVAALGNELLAQRFVERDVFMTAELWGVASTPPYGHRNDLTTLDAIIRAHGGEARASRDAYVKLSDDERSAIIAFLKTLKVEP